MSKPMRQIRIYGDVAIIPLTRGREAIIDAADVPLVEGHSWCADQAPDTAYAVCAIKRGGKKRKIYLHRLITDAGRGQSVDHANRDGLDNRRENLRLCSVSENMCNAKVRRDNKAGLKGVSFLAGSRQWVAQIKKQGKNIVLGYFDNPEDGHQAYRLASSRYHGEFGRAA